MRLSTISATTLVLLAFAGSGESADVQPLIETIRSSHRVGTVPTAALDALTALGTSIGGSESLDREVMSELFVVIADAQAHPLVRIRALELVCEKAPREALPRILETVQSLVERLGTVQDRENSEFSSIPAIVYQFADSGASRVASRLDSQTPLLDLLVTILVQSKPYGHIRAACFERIADSPASLRVRQNYMLRVVKMLSGDRCPQPFVSLVNAEVLEPLRKIAFEGPVGPKGYNSAALELLAEHGDRQTAGQLRGWAAEQGSDVRTLARVGGYIWMIDSQHTPSMLLDHIRSNQWVNHQTRPWALRRAIQLGMSHADLRGAMLDHARSMHKDERLRADMVVLKRIALEHGVIAADDLSAFDDR